MKHVKRILNLGAGVQSTTLALMGVKNWYYWSCSEPVPYPQVGLIELALFADTQSEPRGVYEHLKWLKLICEKWFPIQVLSLGNLAENLLNGVNDKGKPFIQIPAFTAGGIKPRQCTSHYKVNLMEKYIRYQVLGLKPGQRAPIGNEIIQLMGLSHDETARIIRVKARYQSVPWGVEFPLWEMELTRVGCRNWLKKYYPDREVPRSACTFCPYHSDSEWQDIKKVPEDWAQALAVDEAIRNHDHIPMFLHDSRKPLAEVDFHRKDKKNNHGLLQECEGACGV